jgi:hypothetical protein
MALVLSFVVPRYSLARTEAPCSRHLQSPPVLRHCCLQDQIYATVVPTVLPLEVEVLDVVVVEIRRAALASGPLGLRTL